MPLAKPSLSITTHGSGCRHGLHSSCATDVSGSIGRWGWNRAGGWEGGHRGVSTRGQEGEHSGQELVPVLPWLICWVWETFRNELLYVSSQKASVLDQVYIPTAQTCVLTTQLVQPAAWQVS